MIKGIEMMNKHSDINDYVYDTRFRIYSISYNKNYERNYKLVHIENISQEFAEYFCNVMNKGLMEYEYYYEYMDEDYCYGYKESE